MRGRVSDAYVGAGGGAAGAGLAAVSAAYRISGPVPALFHEDPLFLGLCAAFDELLGPLVGALDCFGAYLDPWLAPDDFLAWLGALVGADIGGVPGGEARTGSGAAAALEVPDPGLRRRALVAGAVRGYRVRGTVRGLRTAVAAATGVPAGQIAITEPGAVTWSQAPRTTVPAPAAPAPNGPVPNAPVPGAPVPGACAPNDPAPGDPVVTITIAVPPGRDRTAVAAIARGAAESALPVSSQLRIEVIES